MADRAQGDQVFGITLGAMKAYRVVPTLTEHEERFSIAVVEDGAECGPDTVPRTQHGSREDVQGTTRIATKRQPLRLAARIAESRAQSVRV